MPVPVVVGTAVTAPRNVPTPPRPVAEVAALERAANDDAGIDSVTVTSCDPPAATLNDDGVAVTVDVPGGRAPEGGVIARWSYEIGEEPRFDTVNVLVSV